MTNAQIIESEQMLRGITEELHTFMGWKQRGFMVQKGQHAAVTTKLWKEVKDKETGEKKMIMVKSFLFKESQVARA